MACTSHVSAIDTVSTSKLPHSIAMNGHSNGDVDLGDMEYDPLQLEMMKEELIVVDTDDNPIGKDSKKTCAWRASMHVDIAANTTLMFLIV